MSVDNYWYSSLNKNPTHIPADGYSLASFYDLLTTPKGILGTLIAFIILLHKDISNDLKSAIQGEEISQLHLLLLLFTIIIGVRLIHSIYLAKRDYKNLESGFGDIFIFLTVIFFATGGVLKIIRHFMEPTQQYLVTVLIIYAIGGFIGALNFFLLWYKRIPIDDENYDYPIEKRIQIINTEVFLYLTVIFILMFCIIKFNLSDMSNFYWLIGSGCILVILNIVHSGHLTFRPKFLLNNKRDNLDSLIKEFREKFSHINGLKTECEIKNNILNKEHTIEKVIKTIRATPADAELIADELVNNFYYMFHFLADTDDNETLKCLMKKLILSTSGFGAFGYMQFYFIIANDNKKVGLFKIETCSSNWLYSTWVAISLTYILISSLGFIKFWKSIRRTKQILSVQKKPVKNEFQLSYLIIFNDYKHQGYGKALTRLLLNAYLNNRTDDILIDRFTLIVREKNGKARQFFKNTGFKECTSSTIDLEIDQFTNVQDIGRPILMECRRETDDILSV